MVFVTRSNWEEALRSAKEHIERADFVAIDCELTGVETTPWRAGTQVDTLETRYLNLRDSAQKFGLLQFGLCPFLYDAAEDKFTAHPYNFCLFPRQELAVEMPARDFLCQATSLEFIAKHGFDFNACVHEGISFLSREQEVEARARLGLKKDEEVYDIPLTRTADVLFSEQVRVEVGEWRDHVLVSRGKEEDNQPSLLLDVRGNHEANLVHQLVRKCFQDLVPLTQVDGKQVKVIFPNSEDERARLLAEWERDREARMEARVLEAVGFRQVIDTLVSCKKPVVGHNCFLDLAHVYSKFFGPLPFNCADFCSSLRQQFECIFDTKYLLNCCRQLSNERCTTLGVVYDRLSSSGVKVDIASARYSNSELKHEAGYDAFMTGFVFASISNTLKFTSFQTLVEDVKQQREAGLPGCSNLLYMGWKSQFVLDVTTGYEAAGLKALKMHKGSKAGPRCERAALVWGCSRVSDLEEDIRSSFKGTGQCPDFDTLPLGDEDSAFLVFKHKKSMETLVEGFEGGSSSGAQTCRAGKLLATGLKVARFEMFERLCRSPLSTAKLGESAGLFYQEQQTASTLPIKRARHT